MPDQRPIIATYRLQLTPEFGFADAEQLVPYLAELGISHLYLSPIMRAVSGSTHGYDVVDPTEVSPELGGETAFRALVTAAKDHGLGVIIDFVPNHMCTSEENRFWTDPALRRHFFDIDEESGWHRRFFTIDELAGVRVEDPDVFERTHVTILRLVDEGLVDGLRIDHPDGLADPANYLQQLRERGVERIWVEKILEAGEELRDWPVRGTTGYEFANDVTALFVDPAGEMAMTDLYTAFTGDDRSFAEVAADAKLEQAHTAFAPELAKLRSLLDRPDLEQATAALPVYRTYIAPSRNEITDEDRAILADLPDAIRRVLLLEEPGHDEFVARFQQTTGPVMAKGVEDTAFYRYLRLTALNEVGGDPARFSLSIDEFHEANSRRAARFPEHMLASQTHDTKRSGDVRARIAALSGLAEDWRAHVEHWHDLNAELRDGPGPDAHEEYLIYQTLIGAWPITADRLGDYLEKAMREAKRTTNWDEPNVAWEQSVIAFAGRLLDHPPFLESFEPFAARCAADGLAATLGALLLRLTSPGFADIYQGDELLCLNLVDPDNRRPIDWPERHRALTGLTDGQPASAHTVKLQVIHTTLALRAQRPDAFVGTYTPLPAAEDVCAFTRGDDVAVIVGLHPDANIDQVSLPGDSAWQDVLAPLRPWAPLRLAVRLQ